jgi:type I restriction enzyme M protein
MIVLRRLDCVLEPTKTAVLKRYEKLTAQNMPENAMEKLLGKAADRKRQHPLCNISPFTFAKLLGDAENIAPNLVSYINGFSPTRRARYSSGSSSATKSKNLICASGCLDRRFHRRME